MSKKVNSHIGYYISLIFILLFGYALALVSSSNKQLQMIVVVLTTLFYVAWGVLHHLLNHDLTAKIVVEYILIGSLGLSLMLFILKTGLGF